MLQLSGLVAGSILAFCASAFAQSSEWMNPQGLPPTKGRWQQIKDERTSSTFRVYKDVETGQVVTLNPRSSEVVMNPVNGQYEAVLREPVTESDGATENAGQPASWQSGGRATFQIPGQGSLMLNTDSEELAKNPVTGRIEAVMKESVIAAFSRAQAWAKFPGDSVLDGGIVSPENNPASPNYPAKLKLKSADAYTLAPSPSTPSQTTASTPAPMVPEGRKLIRTERRSRIVGGSGHNVEGSYTEYYTIYYYSDGTTEER